jgi:hypothetical protein
LSPSSTFEQFQNTDALRRRGCPVPCTRAQQDYKEQILDAQRTTATEQQAPKILPASQSAQSVAVRQEALQQISKVTESLQQKALQQEVIQDIDVKIDSIVAKKPAGKLSHDSGDDIIPKGAAPLHNLVDLQALLVTVPEGSVAGGQLQVKLPGGRMVTVLIPPGFSEGQQLRIPASPRTITSQTVWTSGQGVQRVQSNGTEEVVYLATVTGMSKRSPPPRASKAEAGTFAALRGIIG